MKMRKLNMRAALLSAALCSTFSMGAITVTDKSGASYNPLQTAIPSLSIAPDAVGGGMGDVGAATKPDNMSQHWNAAKYALAESKGGFSVSYTPWLRRIVNDIDLAYLSGYYKPTERTAIGASFRYFSMGEVTLTNMPDYTGQPVTVGTSKPYELAADVSFSMLLNEYWSGGVALRFIYSDLFNGFNGVDDDQYSKAAGVGADINFAFRKPVIINENTSYGAFGVSITNIGNKVSYDNKVTYQFIPTNFKMGGSFEYAFDKYNTLQLAVDINKLLVPTPYGSIDDYESEKEHLDAKEEYENTGSIGGIFKSLGDAPGGFKEEMREFTFSTGLEYAYNKKFMVRGGYFNESKYKGGRKYFSVGAGFNLMIFQLNAAYMITVSPNNPLDRTLRFTLGFDMGGLRDIIGVKEKSGDVE